MTTYLTDEIRALDAEIDRLRAALVTASSKIEELAFAIPAPNPHTPKFVELAVVVRQASAPRT